MNMSKVSLFFIVLTISTSGLMAQTYRFLQTEIYAVQVSGGLLQNTFSSEFKQFGGTVSCDEFNSGSGNGFSFGIQGEYPLSNVLALSGGLGFRDRSGLLSTSSTFPIRDDNSTSGFSQANMENTIDASMQFIEFQTDLRYNIFEVYGFVLRGIGGLRFGIPLSGEFHQKTRIVSPESIGFVVGNQTLQERTLGSGEITTYNPLQIGGVIGIEPMVRVSPSMHITATAFYDLPFTSTLNDATLNISGFRGQIGLRYSMRIFAPSPNTP